MACRWTDLTDGCDGVAVSTVGCGPASPGSIPGHGPIFVEIDRLIVNLIHLHQFHDPF